MSYESYNTNMSGGWWEQNQARKIPQLLFLNSEETLSFQNAIKEYDGVIHVAVHPFYEVGGNGDFDSEETIKQYTHGNCMRDLLRSGLPVVVFGEPKEEGKTTSEEKIRMTKISAPTCVVTTIRNNPAPNIPAANSECEAWNMVSDKLRGLGVKKIILGGRELHHEPDGKDTGCVPLAANALKSKFEVTIDRTLCYPDGEV